FVKSNASAPTTTKTKISTRKPLSGGKTDDAPMPPVRSAYLLSPFQFHVVVLCVGVSTPLQ
ncbi:MAG: hypothetical protein ACXVLX_22720, partial [Ilumatobacteraceae bacterium]